MAKAVFNLQWFLVTPTYALVRFGRWQEVLTTPPPAADMPFTMEIWHYARGVASAARNQTERADEELAALEKIAAMPEIEKMMFERRHGNAHLEHRGGDCCGGGRGQSGGHG